MKTNLHKDLASGGWHSSLMTTYSLDPTFYDSFIERRLRRSGCENNILLADAAMLSCAMQATPEAFRAAGRRYAVVPVSVPGCFHPKIHLRLGRDRARLIVGSANATAAGWCRNLEVLADLDWGRRDGEQTCVPLIRKSYDYLMHWLSEAPGDAVQYKCRMIERESPWLHDIAANTSDVELEDGSSIDIFCEHGGDSPSILKQLVKRVAGERIRRLVLVSPYWDANLRGLRELRKALSECPTVIALNPEKSHFPVDVLRRKDDDLQFIELTAGIDSKRFPHAKVILVETSQGDHVLFGSTNCSDDALGLMGGVARNAEVSVYRRLKPGTVREALALDLRRKLDRSSISPPIPPDSPAENDNKSFDAGYLELSGRVVGWYPPAGIDGTGAMIRIGGTDAPVRVANGQLRAEFRDAPTGALIARVTLKSGQVSFPIVVHDENALRRAAPGQIDSRLRETFDRIRKGEEDLLDLAQYAHMIFAADPTQERAGRGRQKGRRSKTADEKVVVYDTADEFRRAIALEPASGSTGRFSVDDPGLLQLLSIIMRGVGGVEAPEDREVLDDQEDAHLEAGDFEDDGMQSGEEDDSDEQRDMPRSSTGGPRYFTVEQINRRRSRLKKTMDSFQDLLTRLSAGPSLVSSRLATQTAFMIQLMVLACTLEHQRQDGTSVRLMVPYPFHDSERETSFALRVARMLRSIWVGPNRLAQKVLLDSKHKTLPDDLVAWIVLSRWAIARAYLTGRDSAGILPKQIGDVARGVFASTVALGPIELEAENKMMRELDARMGVKPSETDALVRYASDLRASTLRMRPDTSSRTAATT